MYELDPYLTDILLRDLVGHDRRPAAFLVYLWLTAEQQKHAQQKKSAQQKYAQQGRASAVSISYQDLAESIGISKSSAQSAVAWLIRRKLLASTKATVTATPEYKVLTPWQREHRR
jgi:protein-disulfide isomerase-like protein with CxxC motif